MVQTELADQVRAQNAKGFWEGMAPHEEGSTELGSRVKIHSGRFNYRTYLWRHLLRVGHHGTSGYECWCGGTEL